MSNSDLLAIDVAILPPPEIAWKAIDLSATLPAEGSGGLRLDADHLPHITLTQLFARANELEHVFKGVDETLRNQPALSLGVAGNGHGASSVWMAIERTPEIVDLHHRLMEALRGIERPGSTPSAFFGGDARAGDVTWVASFRLKSSFGAYTPHITLGHGTHPPRVEPVSFVADTVAVCHLGRFCSCRRVLRQWRLAPAA